jgi:hypothetical protein
MKHGKRGGFFDFSVFSGLTRANGTCPLVKFSKHNENNTPHRPKRMDFFSEERTRERLNMRTLLNG